MITVHFASAREIYAVGRRARRQHRGLARGEGLFDRVAFEELYVGVHAAVNRMRFAIGFSRHESGLDSCEVVRALEAEGVHAFLVGEALMRERDPGAALRRLRGAP